MKRLAVTRFFTRWFRRLSVSERHNVTLSWGCEVEGCIFSMTMHCEAPTVEEMDKLKAAMTAKLDQDRMHHIDSAHGDLA